MLRLRLAAALGLAAACAGTAATAGLVAAPAALADSVRDGQMWALDMMNVPSAWAAGNEGQGVTVAVLDSGVAPNVSDLSGSVVTGPDLTGVSTSPSDPDWGQHGTWMASVIAGHGHGPDDQDGIMGVAPRAKILSVRVIPDRNDPGYSTYEKEAEARVQDSLAQGIRYAVNHGADVISMSIGYSAPSASVRSALQYAYGHGVAVVASSGNSGDTSSASKNGYAPLKFPADYPGVIGVAAVSSSGRVAGFSSDNLSVEVAAPGVNISAQGRDGQYWLVTGTSPACALVAGVAALIKAKYPGLAPDLLAKALTSTTHFRPAGGYDQKIGFGTVNATAALTAAGQLAHERAPQTGTAASNNFGGGPSAAPANPVAPRGSGQLILFSLLALTALVLVGASVSRLAVLKQLRRRTLAAASVPVGGSSFGRPPPDPSGPARHRSGQALAPAPFQPHLSSADHPAAQPDPPSRYNAQSQPAPSSPDHPQAQGFFRPSEDHPQPQDYPRSQGDPSAPGAPQSQAFSRPSQDQSPPQPQVFFRPSHQYPPSQNPPGLQDPQDPQGLQPQTQPAPHSSQDPRQPHEPHQHQPPAPHEPQDTEATRPLPVPREQQRPPGWWPAVDADD
ncbi:MAG TPA: S8 family serine peptidase [Streptosporangiaceae bacterium]|nr:S8 family serine peptidase [Streptosporangiaceae bacterium]